MSGGWLRYRNAVEKFDEAGRSPRDGLPPLTVDVGHEAWNLASGIMQMLQQRIEKRQIIRVNAVFIERQNEAALRRFDKEIAVLDAFGNPFERDEFAGVILVQQRGNLFRAQLRINGQVRLPRQPVRVAA